MAAIDRTALLNVVLQRFTLVELKRIAFDLHIEYDDLVGNTRQEKALALIEHLEHRGQLSRLVGWSMTHRPDIDLTSAGVVIPTAPSNAPSRTWRWPLVVAPLIVLAGIILAVIVMFIPRAPVQPGHPLSTNTPQTSRETPQSRQAQITQTVAPVVPITTPVPTSRLLSPTIPSTALAERRLLIAFDGRGKYEKTGVSLRPVPLRSALEIISLYPPEEVIVVDGPFYNSADPESLIWWRVRSKVNGEGYVADRVIDGLGGVFRLVKPKLSSRDIVRVSKSDGVNWRDDRCNERKPPLDYGDQLNLVAGPERKCNYLFGCEECEWWQVQTARGQGWVADVSSTNKDVLIAPQWYIDAMSNIPLR